jgi:hypothetical protein
LTVAGSTWLWGGTYPGHAYVELEARSYRDAVRWCVKHHGRVPQNLQIIGYRAEVPAERQPDRAKDRPWRRDSVRSLAGLALRLYMVLRVDYPTRSVLCDEVARHRISDPMLRDFLANVGSAVRYLPNGERVAVSRWIDTALRATAASARSLNSRGLREDLEEERAYYQDRAHNLRRRVDCRRGLDRLSMALDGMLPEQEETAERFVAALVAHGVPEDEAEQIAWRCRRVAVPRM